MSSRAEAAEKIRHELIGFGDADGTTWGVRPAGW